MNEPVASRLSGLRLPFDPLLALATLGLMAASIVSLNATTPASQSGPASLAGIPTNCTVAMPAILAQA